MEIGEAVVQSIVLHQVGNRLREEPLMLADKAFLLTENISEVILGGYLRGIVSDKNQYVLSHENDITLNDVAYFTTKFFNNKIDFLELSKKLATHLYNSAHHPNIASGDLFIILFDKLKINDIYGSAIGIYKSESKQQYLSAYIDEGNHQLEVVSGINPELIDKGVLIINNCDSIYAVDRLSSRTKYWIDDFLKAKQIPNENTKSSIAVGFIEKIKKNIHDPLLQQSFSRDVATLCSSKDEVNSNELKTISAKYVDLEIINTELEGLIGRKGLVEVDSFNACSSKLKSRLKRVFNHIELGQDMRLTVPEGISLVDADLVFDGDLIQLKIALEKKNG